MKREIDPKLVTVVVGVLIIGVIVGAAMYFRTPANFSGPRVEIHAPKGFVAPGQPAAAPNPAYEAAKKEALSRLQKPGAGGSPGMPAGGGVGN